MIFPLECKVNDGIFPLECKVNDGVYREYMLSKGEGGGGTIAGGKTRVQMNGFLRLYNLTPPILTNDEEPSFRLKYLFMFVWELNEDQWGELIDHLKGKYEDISECPDWHPLKYDDLKDFKYFPFGVTFYNSKDHEADTGVFDGINIMSRENRTLYAQKRGSVDISCQLEMRKFPFDVQKLKIDIRITNVDADYLKLWMCAVEYSQDVLEKDTYHILKPELKHCDSGINDVVTVTALRDYSHFIRQLIVLAFVVLYGAYVFSFGLSETDAALANLGTVILTVIAYKFAVASSLPLLSYSTLFDKYMDLTLVFLFLFGTWIAYHGFYFQQHERSDEDMFWNNVGGCIAYLAIYIIGSLLWFLYGYENQRKEWVTYNDEMKRLKQEMIARQELPEHKPDLNFLVFKYERYPSYLPGGD